MEILKYCFPALIVLLATWLVLFKMLREERDKREFELRKASHKEALPIRLRGYERFDEKLRGIGASVEKIRVSEN